MSSVAGLSKMALDTPALVIDLDAMAANIDRISRTCSENGVAWRPHIKGQKTPEIARAEIAAGAIGITCAKLGEAEVMAEAGIRDILIANQIIGASKIGRVVALLDRADAIVAVDDLQNINALAEAAGAGNRRLRIVIEVNIGMNRAGVEPGGSVVALAAAITRCPALQFAGLMGWESHATTIPDPSKKRTAVAEAIGLLTSSAAACRAAGYPPSIVSCGGSGTFPFCAEQPGVTEIQAGGGIFGDEHYREHYHVNFQRALTLMATVTSRPTATRIVVDAGRKAMSGDAAMPVPIGLPGVQSVRLSAEHATIELTVGSAVPAIGDRVEFAVGYSDTTVHLHEEIFAIRGDRVEAAWPVLGRGKLK
ncbi:MAG: DSD1 family PLP-dependent enzyme [Proteobacteria bacterium]|nr:DSD1 family PLP-dependent enzyme [Pseudomonadota bacterium]